MSAGGQHLKQVTDQIIPGTRVSWNKDGHTIAYMAKDSSGVPQIHLIQTDGSGDEQLKTDELTKDDPMFSPDGTQLVFWQQPAGGSNELAIVRGIDTADPQSASTTTVEVITGAIGANDPSWSPDGKTIAYTYPTTGGNSAIHLLTLADGADRALTDGTDHDMDPDWSPQSTWICFVRGPIATPVIWAARADGSGLRAVGPAGDGHPDW
jgi:Tol biopolymer transport system component